MANLRIDLKLKNLTAKFKANTTLIFYILFLAVLVMDAFILYQAASQIVASRQESSDLAPSRGVRLQFAEYQQAAKRIEAGREFLPGPPLYENPFGTK